MSQYTVFSTSTIDRERVKVMWQINSLVKYDLQLLANHQDEQKTYFQDSISFFPLNHIICCIQAHILLA